MSENIRIQSELNTDLEVYRLKGELLQLREQNRVLRQALLKVKPELYCMDKQLIASGYKRGASVADAMRSLEAALTATSQPQPPNQGGPSVSCNIANCFTCKDATSQEGQG